MRPDRPNGRGAEWESLEGQRDRIAKWAQDGFRAVKIGDLLTRDGVLVLHRTLHRFCVRVVCRCVEGDRYPAHGQKCYPGAVRAQARASWHATRLPARSGPGRDGVGGRGG